MFFFYYPRDFALDVKYRFDEESKELKGADVLGDQIQEGTGVVSHIFSQVNFKYLKLFTFIKFLDNCRNTTLLS